LRILILGANGFLGAACCTQFSSAGYQVLRSDKIGPADFLGDLSDLNFVGSLPDADVVVNCAAVQYVTKNLPIFSRESFFFLNNVVSAKNLSSRFKKTRTHVIHVGSSMMYKVSQNSYDESNEMVGSGFYSRSKVEAQHYIERLPLAATVVPCIIGGPGRGGLFPKLVKSISKFGVAIFPGSGDHPLSMVHVSDVASLIFKIAERSETGFFNAAASDALSISQWVDEIAVALGKEGPLRVKLPITAVEIASKILNYTFLAQEQLQMLSMPHVIRTPRSLSIGWKPNYTSAETIRGLTAFLSVR